MSDLSAIPTADIERQRDMIALIHPAEAVRASQLESALNEVLRLRRLLAATDGKPVRHPVKCETCGALMDDMGTFDLCPNCDRFHR